MFVYKIEFPNGKVYVGQTNNLVKRKNRHLYEVRNGNNRYLYNAIRKYLGEELKLVVVDTAKTQEELDEKEIYWINHYRSFEFDKGYNLNLGGSGNPKANMSEEQRRESLERWRKQMVGRPGTMSLEAIAQRNNCSLEEARKLTPMYGKKASDYAKKRASETHKGKKVSKETVQKWKESKLKTLYTITNDVTGEVFETKNLFEWCKEKGLPYGVLNRRAKDPSIPRRKAKEWTITTEDV
jgi:group I intron endonuclease